MTRARRKQGEPQQGQLGPELALWAVVLIWSSTFIAMKDAFKFIDPLPYTLFRFFWINLLAFAVLFIQHRRDPRLPVTIRRRDLPRFLLASVPGYTLYQICSVLGLDHSSVFTLSLLVAMVPLFTMLLLAVMGESTTRYGWIGLAVAVVGVVVFLSDKRSGDDSILGATLSLGAAVAFAFYGVVNRPLVRDYPGATYTAYSLLFGTIPLIFVAGPALIDQTWSGIPLRFWLGTIYVVIFPVYIAYQLWNYAIQRRGAAAASSYGLIVPVVSGILSAIVFGERFGALKVGGAGLVMAGVLVQRARRAPLSNTGAVTVD
jgi:drug/metabolite transporter (DMT)-like permease